MSVSLVQTNQAQFGNVAVGQTLAYGSNVTAGNFLVAAISAYAAGASVTVSDNLNGSWGSKVVDKASGSVYAALYVFPGTLGGACTVTITPGMAEQLSVGIAEFSGVLTSSPTDGTNTGGGSATAFGVSVPVTAVGELILSVMSQSSANFNWTIMEGAFKFANLTQGRIGGNPTAGLAAAFCIAKYAPNQVGPAFNNDQSSTAAVVTASFKTQVAVIPPATTRSLPMMPKVQDRQNNQHVFSHNLLSDMVNSLLESGQLVLVGPGKWQIKV